ncbi:hypothetical protein BKA59DRAFT_409503, partial [Fusarium tricinctum]
RNRPELNDFSNGIIKASFNFDNADPQAVDYVVQFFYLWDYKVRSLMPRHILDQDILREKDTGDSPGSDNTTAPEGPLLILHSKVFTPTHIYDIPRLIELSIKKFKAVTQVQWESNSLLDTARETYTSTPSNIREIRKAIIKTLYKHRGL